MLSRQASLLPIYRIQVYSKLHHREEAIKEQILSAGIPLPAEITLCDLYFLEGNLTETDLQQIAENLILDSVTESYTHQEIRAQDRVELFKGVETTFKAGVNDNVANQLLQAAYQLGVENLVAVKTGQRYQFTPEIFPETAKFLAQNFLINETIQTYTIGEISPEFNHPVPVTKEPERIPIADCDDDALMAISASRRLALNLEEMQAVQAYFQTAGVVPTDAELETIAQTWSEHCVHKTFKAKVTIQETGEKIDSIIKTYLQAATKKINAPWVRSAFVDNAGVIAFDDEVDLSFKVETHNHPSAIEPFGGANTGIGGVVRDILGVSHRPIANTDVLCFGPQDLDTEHLPEGVLHPRRIKAGVLHGIEDYGNKLGLPTVNGSVHYHLGYVSNPLVYCGCVGIGPIGSHPNDIQQGDRVIVLGGRTGRDGIRGATFSSQEMDVDTGEIAGSSVQIGDPITEKGLLEVVERARDAGLYTAITDCGAGGLSSAVGEMSADCGVQVDLQHVPLKYDGLAPWEIWLSEAQERVVLAVPEAHLPALQKLCDSYWVELSNIGFFENSGHLRVYYGETCVVDLENEFLHHGLPRHTLEASLQKPVQPSNRSGNGFKLEQMLSENEMLLALLRHPDITSKEEVIRRYDHEVRGSTIVKPFAGEHQDGPSDAAVLKPQQTKGWKGFSLANGINPHLGEVDAYGMAVSVIDEAIRNAVAVGTDPEKIAILDNFCWGNPNYPEVMGSLIQASRGCYDAAVHFGTPFISGKDSLYNEYVDESGVRRAIPGTLLISSIGIVPDVRKAITSDLKKAGNPLYLVGEWQGSTAGSHASMIDPTFFDGGENSLRFPEGAPQVYKALHQAILQGLVCSAHDLSDGGLAVTLAEMALAGRKGLTAEIDGIDADPRLGLFGETNGCLVVEVSPENQEAFEAAMQAQPYLLIGKVTGETQFVVAHDGHQLLELEISDLVQAFTQQEGQR